MDFYFSLVAMFGFLGNFFLYFSFQALGLLGYSLTTFNPYFFNLKRMRREIGRAVLISQVDFAEN